MKEIIPFKFAGPLDPDYDNLIAIIRDEELKEVVNGLYNNTYYALIAPKQTGKTTFLFQLMNKMTKSLPGFQGVYITLEDLIQVERQEFYKSFARKIITYLNSHYKVQPASIRDRYKTVNTNLDLKDFFLELARAKFCHPDSEECIEFEAKEYKKLKLILLIDEIEAIPQEIMIEFVKTVRSIFIERLSIEGFKAYTMILCGSEDLCSLTYGKTSPFNISKVIYIRDFSFEEIRNWFIQIFQHLEVQFDDPFIQQLFEQTHGHPYLTQIICSKIIKRLQREGRDKVNQDDFKEIDHIISSGDINLLTTLEKIRKDELLQEMILKILKGDSIRYSRTHDIIYNLELAGAIRREDGYCQIRNPIYEKFFRQHFNI